MGLLSASSHRRPPPSEDPRSVRPVLAAAPSWERVAGLQDSGSGVRRGRQWTSCPRAFHSWAVSLLVRLIFYCYIYFKRSLRRNKVIN